VGSSLTTSTDRKKEFQSVHQHHRDENEAPVRFPGKETANPRTKSIIPQAVDGVGQVCGAIGCLHAPVKH